MNTNIVFPNPTVIKVIFQITFPNLFYLESKISDIQLDIMSKFQESALIVKQPVTFIGQNKPDDENQITQKIWQFKSNSGYTLQLTSRSLSIDSEVHKTYDNPSSEVRLRDSISFCLDVFEKHVKLPYVNRIGLRYIDKCPLSSKTSEDYFNTFTTALDLSKFRIEDLENFEIKVVKKIDNHYMTYRETYGEPDFVYLDIDAFSNEVSYDKCLDVCDELHDIVKDGFFTTIKEPIFKYMEGK